MRTRTQETSAVKLISVNFIDANNFNWLKYFNIYLIYNTTKTTVNKSPVHTTRDKFEIVALFLPSVHTAPSQNRIVDGQHFLNRTFRKRWGHDFNEISLPESASDTKQNDR